MHTELPINIKEKQPLFHHIFEQRVLETPNNKALQMKNNSLTYKELNEQANQLCFYLIINYDLKMGDRVAIVLDKSFNVFISILAIVKAGATFVLVDSPAQTEAQERFEYCLKLSDSKLILSTKNYQNQLDLFASYIEFVDLLEKKLIFYNTVNPTINNLNQETPLFVTFTSGSTGSPKGIVIKHEGLYSRIAAHQQIFKLKKTDVIAQFCPLSVDAVIIEFTLALSTGACLDLVPIDIQENMTSLSQYFNSQKINLAIFTPTVLNQLDSKEFTSELRGIITTGEDVTVSLLKKWELEGRVICNGYGPAEFTICSSLWIYDGGNSVAIGKGIEGTEMFLLEPVTKEVINQSSVSGEIYLRGLGLAVKYLGSAELYNKKFIDIKNFGICYKTSDKARYNDQNEIVFEGRFDRQIKKYGRLISLEEIEKVLNDHFEISSVIIEVIEPSKTIVAKIILNNSPENEILLKHKIYSISKYCSKKLPAHMIPARWSIASANDNKNIKLFNWKKNTQNTFIYKTYLANKIEEKFTIYQKDKKLSEIIDVLTNLWSDILLNQEEKKCFSIGIYDSFFNIGGDSLLYKILFTRLENLYNKVIFSRQDFRKNPTIAFLANCILKQNDNFTYIKLNKFAEQNDSNNIPVILIHSLLGNALNDYADLAEKINLPVFAISARGLQKPYLAESIYELALDYINLIKEIIVNKKVVLGGWSFGGLVANEMAKQLREKNYKVILFLFDSTAPRFLQSFISNESHKKYAKRLGELTWKYLNQKYPCNFTKVFDLIPDNNYEAQVNRVFNHLQEQCNDTQGFSIVNPDYVIEVARNNALATLKYNQALLGPDDYLFVAQDKSFTEVDNHLEWDIQEGNIYSLPGNHTSIMSRDSNENCMLIKLFMQKIAEEFLNPDIVKIKIELEKIYSSRFEEIITPTTLVISNKIETDPLLELKDFSIMSLSFFLKKKDCFKDLNKYLNLEDVLRNNDYKRINIISPYGISLLYNQIIYRWKKNLLHNQIKYVFWINAEKLIKMTDSCDSLEQLINYACFSNKLSVILSSALTDSLPQIINNSLFIIDNFDIFTKLYNNIFTCSALCSLLKSVKNLIVASSIETVESKLFGNFDLNVSKIKTDKSFMPILVRDMPLTDRIMLENIARVYKNYSKNNFFLRENEYFVENNVINNKSETLPILKVLEDFLANDKIKLFLLKGITGSGKTLLIHQIQELIWKNLLKSNNKTVPVIFNINIFECDSYLDLINKIKDVYQCTDILLAHFNILLLCDNFDDEKLKKLVKILSNEKLSNIKFFVCIQQEKLNISYFYKSKKRLIQNWCVEYYLSPFDNEKVETYINKVQCNAIRQDQSFKDFIQKFNYGNLIYNPQQLAVLKDYFLDNTKIDDINFSLTLTLFDRQLLDAVKNGDLENTQQAIKYCANVNCTANSAELDTNFFGRAEHIEGGASPIHYAAQKGYVAIGDILLQNNAYIDKKTHDGETALHISAGYGEAEFVKLLLKYKLNINEKTKEKWTALHIAARNDYTNTCILLLDNNANINEPDEKGWTSIYYAMINNKINTILLLIIYNADLSSKDNEGKTVLDYMTIQICRIVLTCIALIFDRPDEYQISELNDIDKLRNHLNSLSIFTDKNIGKTKDIASVISSLRNKISI